MIQYVLNMMQEESVRAVVSEWNTSSKGSVVPLKPATRADVKDRWHAVLAPPARVFA
jgi:hypothetical protein